MARIRTVKPEFFVSESLAEVSIWAERTFGGLITQVDDDGRYKDNAAILHGAIWALRPEHTAVDVEQDLIALAAAGLICRYTVAGKRYLHLVTFKVHQKISHATPSKLPACPLHHGEHTPDAPDSGASPHPSGPPPADSGVFPEDFGAAPIGSGSGSGSGSGKEVEREGEDDFVVMSATAPPPPDTPRGPGREDVARICNHLAERIQGNTGRSPTITGKWRDAARLMLDRDHLTEAEIHAAIDWTQDHEFWRANILSLPKLREKYVQLKLQAERQSRASPPRRDGPDWNAAMARAEARDAAEATATSHDPDNTPLWKALPT